MHPVLRYYRGLLGLLLGGAAVAVIVWLGFYREPRYQGHPLSFWVLLNAGGEGDRPCKPEYALAQISTNGVPHLVRWMNGKPNRWQTALLKYKEGGRLFSRWIPPWADGSGVQERASAALLALQCIGPTARPAIPDLARFAANPATSWDLRRLSLNILVGIGPESIPALVNIATDRQAPEREWVLFEIAQFGEAARPAVSPLVECLKDPDPQVVLGAARILASLRVEPTATVPALLSCLQGVDRLGLGEPSKAWYYATHGLAQFGTNAQIAMPVLIDELERRREDDDQVCHLMMTMATVAAEPKVVVQVLMNYLQGTNQLLCFYSASALGKLGPSARAALPSLTNALQYPETQEVVSKAIREIDSDSAGTAGAD